MKETISMTTNMSTLQKAGYFSFHKDGAYHSVLNITNMIVKCPASMMSATIHALTSSALLPWFFHSLVFSKAFALVQPYQPPNTNRTFTLCSLPSGLLFSFHIYILSFKCTFLIGKSDCIIKTTA